MALGERGLDREQQQWREAKEEGAAEQAGQGEFLLVGVGVVLLRVMGTSTGRSGGGWKSLVVKLTCSTNCLKGGEVINW